MNNYIVGCLHLGHPSIAKHRGFSCAEEHDEYLIQEWNKVVPKKAKVYILGDITMENSKHYYKLDLLNGAVKHVVLGNHDRATDIPELLKYVDKVSGMVDVHGCALTHAPIHPNEVVFYRYNFHAHIHHLNKLEEVYVSNRYKDEGWSQTDTLHKYINVDAKLIDFKPVAMQDYLK